jgi:Spy/CpxP family protein refolding chaperone
VIKRLTVLAVFAALAVPAAALGSTPASAASANCKAQLKAMGATNFYNVASGGYQSFGACVSKARHLTNQQRQNLLAAEKTCRAEQLANESAFDAKYGTSATTGKHASAPTSGSKSNAFGKCVSAHNHV